MKKIILGFAVLALLALPAVGQDKEEDRVEKAGTVIKEIMDIPDDVPPDVIDREKSVQRAQLLEQGKAEAMIDKILPGKLDRFFKDMGGCLLEQPFFKDPEGKRSVLDEINAAIAVIGENIQVRRFTRYALGEGLEKETKDFAAEVSAAVGKA